MREKYIKRPHSNAFYEAQNFYKEKAEREGVGKGDRFRHVNRRQYGKNYERIFGKKKYWWEKRKGDPQGT